MRACLAMVSVVKSTSYSGLRDVAARREFVRKGDFFFDRLPNRDLDRTSQATAHSILAASYTEPLLLGRELPSYFTLGHKKWMA